MFKKFFLAFVVIFYIGLINCSIICGMDSSNNNDTFYCATCTCDCNNKEKVELECGHFFCKNCCYNNILQKIKTNVEKIYCMTCSNPDEMIEKKFWRFFTEEQCLGILKEIGGDYNYPTLEETYHAWKRRVIINNSGDTIKACPYKFPLTEVEGVVDCTGILKKDEHNQYSKCDICTKEFCFKCLRDRNEHEIMKCEEYLKEMKKKDDEIFLKTYGKNNIKKCPHCGSHTNKIDGCNHMTCAKCGREWCWICNSIIVNPINSSVPPHYKFGQCRNRQYEDSNEKIEKDVVGWALYILCCDCIL